ncbi:PREDICTED: carbon catabolite repressor protein 4 homolog 6 isoform X2 [Tarenaya hassleriana]|uniref:carbon catabolite repressor protein 4 homolog 6 isoform X2 n=1 Tax=Tarenaya hassleriana TaxID=28532 RepID=UPI00053C7D6C|nr:PREDICTED: carbon catabolite repressor protein 4 homolog 6 isoform X2 [Tarenaya hassleriana]
MVNALGNLIRRNSFTSCRLIRTWFPGLRCREISGNRFITSLMVRRKIKAMLPGLRRRSTIKTRFSGLLCRGVINHGRSLLITENGNSPKRLCLLEKFVVLSYNILADYLANDHRGKLYFHIPRNMLGWESRKRRIIFELGLWSADIMCLQEVDRFQDLEEEMKLRGYSSIWKMRTGNAIDGCAMFWRSNRFKLVHEESIQFNKLGLRDNVAQICVLELLNSRTSKNGVTASESSAGSHRVVVCNIHVLYNPKRGEIKLGQVRTLLERAHAVSKLWDNASVVLCGDFNCTPKSPLYNFILEQKLDLSALARDKVSGQDSAIIRPSRPENLYLRYPATIKSPQVELQSLDSVSDAQTVSNKEGEKAPPGSTSELHCAEKILVNSQAFADSDQVSPGEELGSDGTTESKNRESDGNGEPFVAEDLSSTCKSDPDFLHASDTETFSKEEFSETSFASATGESPPEMFAKDENILSVVSVEVDALLGVKLGDLDLNKPDETLRESEGLGEDRDVFLAELHNNDSGHSLDVLSELSPELESETFKEEKIPYDSSSWTPMEIAAATGDQERTAIEHPLHLTSTYTEVEGKTNTRDKNGEPEVTSYNRCFMGTVDYIWRSQGLETVRVLAPMPKQAMQWTPGFPTPKWGSDHVALVSELAFTEESV